MRQQLLAPWLALVLLLRPAVAPTPPAYQAAALPKLQLGPENAIDMFGTPVTGGGTNGSRALFDEQCLAGDPAAGKGGAVVSTYMPGYTKWEYAGATGGQGVAGLIDLMATHAISDIWINHYSGYVQARIEIFAESPFGAQPVWSYLVNTTQVDGKQVSPPPVCTGWGYAQRWCGWNISKTEAEAPKGRYIVFSVLAPESFYEMVVYGKQQGPPTPPPPPSPPLPAPLMGAFIGINSFVTEPLSRQIAAGSMREYHDWQWDEGAGDPCFPHAQTKFSPDWSDFSSDPFYKSRFAAGIKTHVVLQGRPLCQFGGKSPNKSLANWKCVDNPADIGTNKTMDPRSYAQLAAHVFQYAARYGSVKVADAKLALAAGQPRCAWMGTGLPQSLVNLLWEGCLPPQFLTEEPLCQCTGCPARAGSTPLKYAMSRTGTGLGCRPT